MIKMNVKVTKIAVMMIAIKKIIIAVKLRTCYSGIL